MNHLFHSVRRSQNKQGVALILVLGFLSVLLILAVSFVTLARTERQVASATFESQRGRQLTRTALNAAISDYTASIFQNEWVMQPEKVFVSKRPTGQTSVGDIDDSGSHITLGEAFDWLPRIYHTAAYSNQIKKAEWILVHEKDGDSSSRILGRYAYVCLDMNGGIDANLIALSSGVAATGNDTNRVSVRDIGMGMLEETVDASEFKRLRTGWHGFDSMLEVIRLTDGNYNDGTDTGKAGAGRWRDRRMEMRPALDSNKVSNLVPYSLAAVRGFYNVLSGSFSPFVNPNWLNSNPQLGTFDPAKERILFEEAWNASKMKPQLDQAGFKNLYATIRDYVTPGWEGVGSLYPSSKNIPMLNEFVWQASLKETVVDAVNDLSTYDLTVTLTPEIWYPFRSKDNASPGEFTAAPPALMVYTMDNAPSSNPDLFPSGFTVIIGKSSTDVSFTVTKEAEYRTFSPNYNGGNPKELQPFEWKIFITSPTGGVGITSSGVIPVVLVANKDMGTITTSGGIEPVDRAILKYTPPVRATGLSDGMSSPLVGVEVVDPRLNHVPEHWSDLLEVNSLGQINNQAENAPYYADAGETMYCRNGPMLSPAELGYISVGQPWQTVDLINTNSKTFLAHLETDTNSLAWTRADRTPSLGGRGDVGVFYTNGTINPNTDNLSVWKAALEGLKYSEVPNDSVSKTITSEEVVRIRNRALDFTRPPLRSTAFQGIGEWGVALNQSDLFKNKNLRESILRNTWGLFNPHSGLLTILTIAQPIQDNGELGKFDLDEDTITGERRAVAMVWHDPYSENRDSSQPSFNNGREEFFIRMFKFLDE